MRGVRHAKTRDYRATPRLFLGPFLEHCRLAELAPDGDELACVHEAVGA